MDGLGVVDLVKDLARWRLNNLDDDLLNEIRRECRVLRLNLILGSLR